jgi:hypothetical protein
MRSWPCFRCAGISLGTVLVVVCSAVFLSPSVTADMNVKLKDGRILSLPVSPNDVDSVTFDPESHTRTSEQSMENRRKQPAHRAADQIKADEI